MLHAIDRRLDKIYACVQYSCSLSMCIVHTINVSNDNEYILIREPNQGTRFQCWFIFQVSWKTCYPYNLLNVLFSAAFLSILDIQGVFLSDNF